MANEQSNYTLFNGWGFSIEYPNTYTVDEKSPVEDFIIYRIYIPEEKDKRLLMGIYAGFAPQYSYYEYDKEIKENYVLLKKEETKIGDIDAEYIEGTNKNDKNKYWKELLLNVRDYNDGNLPTKMHVWYFNATVQEKEILEKIIGSIKKNNNEAPPFVPPLKK